LARQLLSYGTGAVPSLGDEEKVEQIVSRVREQNYGFRSLIHEVVQSELFQSK